MNDTMGVIAGSGPVARHRSDMGGRIQLECGSVALAVSRSAVQIAMDRRFKDLRKDRILDTRQIGLALRRLKTIASSRSTELDIEGNNPGERA